MASTTSFDGEIRVAARVIDYLSSGLYQNAAACMKELINNSYDADATEVHISVKPDADVIVIEDNGTGMTQAQFREHFDHVAESHKRDSGERTQAQRLKVGKIGIGFIAANELCDEMELYSTVEGSVELLHVTIEFGEIRKRSLAERQRSDREVVKGDYHGEVLQADSSEHFTKLYLKRIRENAVDQFLKPTGRMGGMNAASLYGLSAEESRDLLAGLGSWDELDLYSQTRVRIGLNVPVRYLPDWHPPKYDEDLSVLTQRAAALGFKVVYDGTEIYKPIVLSDDKGKPSVLRMLNYSGENIEIQGYLFSRHGAYKPKDINGILVRVRESSVGEYDAAFLGYPKQLNPLFQAWTTGELYVEGRLDDALNIDRRTLRDTHPAYVELQEWFLKELSNYLSAVRNLLYTIPSKRRSAAKEATERERLDAVQKRAAQEIGPHAAAAIVEAHGKTPDKPTSITTTERAEHQQSRRSSRPSLLKTLTLAEVYDAVIDAAKATLPEKLRNEFIAELTRRLS